MRSGEAMPPLARTVAMSRTFCPNSRALVVPSSPQGPALLRSGGFTRGLLPSCGGGRRARSPSFQMVGDPEVDASTAGKDQ